MDDDRASKARKHMVRDDAPSCTQRRLTSGVCVLGWAQAVREVICRVVEQAQAIDGDQCTIKVHSSRDRVEHIPKSNGGGIVFLETDKETLNKAIEKVRALCAW